ncbi:hybrid sensor histidine kinase/response regulator [Candidatus Marimicrobium litorale]|uniref:histidine kinase n=1 Tax=Candidatus Marimicrobium litorale TaxID=2518991 RepID=A0ABT3T6T2_9GAMM|nr:response regulator [Candidatus Marimicrobium litorale]MCX2977764.1 hybrid sensor histidine kinase/response regulator [Candidatus Marimicrobium litorale]
MYTEEDLSKLGLSVTGEAEEDNQQKSLNWLLEMDLSEPKETLFTVEDSELEDAGLSAYESEVAARPLVRGNVSGDDIANYVDEEIVISSETQVGDIYVESESTSEDITDSDQDQLMALDYSREREAQRTLNEREVSEGTDILGLDHEDDIAEKYVTLTRIKPVDSSPATEITSSLSSGDDRESSDAVGKHVEEIPEVSGLIEAPVQTQVADPSNDVVANDGGQDAAVQSEDNIVVGVAEAAEDDLYRYLSADDQPETVAHDTSEVFAHELTGLCDSEIPASILVTGVAISDAAAESESEQKDEDDVLEYLANTSDSEAGNNFDRYLLADEHCSVGDADWKDLEALALEERVDDDAGVSENVAIDYHEELLTLEGFAADKVPATTPSLRSAMAAVSLAVVARLEELGLASDSVAAEARLGIDETAINQCCAEGFEPVYAIFTVLPESLIALGEAMLASLHIRLLHTDSGDVWNDLFTSDFAPSGAAPAVSLRGLDNIDEAAQQESASPEGLSNDIFGDDFDEDIVADLALSGTTNAEDIEAAFSDLADSNAGSAELDDVSFLHDEANTQALADSARLLAEQEQEQEQARMAEEARVRSEQEQEQEQEQARIAEEARVRTEQEQDQARIAEEARVRVEVPLAAVENVYPESFIPDYIAFSYSSQSNAEIFSDFLDAFIEEGTLEVEKLENEVHDWEKDMANDALFTAVSRTLHTIKGIAKGVGLQRLGTLVHNFETLLEKMPSPEAGQKHEYFRVVNAWLDALVRGVEQVSNERADIASELPQQSGKADAEAALPLSENSEAKPVESFGAAAELVAIAAETYGAADAQSAIASEPVPDQTPVAKKSRTSALDKKRDKQLADEGAKVLAAQQSVRITSEKLDHLLNLTSQVQQLGVRASQNTSRGRRSSAELQARLSSVHTHIRKISDRALLNVNAQPGKSAPDMDALEMDQYSELQEAANILREGVEDLSDLVDVLARQNAHVEALLKQQSMVISSISSAIQGARVVPVSRLMPGLRRIVRTVSTDLGKVVSFQALNETGALDRDHYARLQVILEHMVRNALDHGIESPDERVAAGKPTGGLITVDVRKSGGDYVIRLSDDGRGIDPDAIRQSAFEKGLDTEIDIDSLTDEEAIRLIFHKGFSTASQLSEISGRGVGMDIVMSELLQIGGDIQIQSALDQGTAFEVRIPSNVSVNGALLVAAAGKSYAIPLNGMIAVEQVPVEEFFAAVEGRETLSLSGVDCEPSYLATLCQGVPLPDRSAWNTFVPVIIAGYEERHMAIAIDNLEEALELVVRSLGAQFSSVPGLAGAATTAEGEAVVALDLNQLVKSAGDDSIAPVVVNQIEATAPLALVVDDSRTQRMVATNQLETVGVETITAENGLVAIDLLNAAHRLPDVILLDVEMPVKDGIETLREIRKSTRFGDLPVIMVTSRTGAKHRALASAAGCSAYMGKPFNFPAMIKQINALTGLELQLS